jgi:Mg2+ and Co2+ transporter CorA
MTATIIDRSGILPSVEAEAVARRVATNGFFWLDLVNEDAQSAEQFIRMLKADADDIAWALRFGRTGRLSIGVSRIRAVTWIADREGETAEIHLFACSNAAVTLWNGRAEDLDEIRQRFVDRSAGLEKDFQQAAGILLQLLLGTLDQVLLRLDTRIDDMRLRLDGEDFAADFASVLPGLRKVQNFSASFSRYSSVARSAAIGVEHVEGMSVHAARELNDYVDQVEDLEEQLLERRRWAMDLSHDFSTQIAQRQSEQISRLTIISMIFLPLSAITGFFGMNFEWMNNGLVGPWAFLLLGVLLPLASVGLTILLLGHRGLIRVKTRR